MNIVKLAERMINREAVQILQAALDAAQRGDLAEVVVVADYAAAGAYGYRASFDDRWRLMGALAWMQHQAGAIQEE
jgi:hypothetical protein